MVSLMETQIIPSNQSTLLKKKVIFVTNEMNTVKRIRSNLSMGVICKQINIMKLGTELIG